MSLTPLGSKLIVKPAQPETARGGIVFPETHTPRSATSGTVLAVGAGPASAHAVRASTIAACRKAVHAADSLDAARDALRQLAARAEDLAEVAVGDAVYFPFTAGSLLDTPDGPVIVLDEASLEAVWTPEQEPVA